MTLAMQALFEEEYPNYFTGEAIEERERKEEKNEHKNDNR